jgi:hypothetical protein
MDPFRGLIYVKVRFDSEASFGLGVQAVISSSDTRQQDDSSVKGL